MNEISKSVQNLNEASSISINQKVYEYKRDGIDVITLSLGEAFFKLPCFDFSKLDFEAGYHYSDTQGHPKLRNVISEHYHSSYGVNFSANDNIIISSGSKLLIYMALMAIVNEGDEVLVVEPYWLSYPEQIRLCHGIPVSIPYNCDLNSNLDNFINKNTKALILNNPNNPSGYCYTEKELKNIYQKCIENNVYLIVDEAYSDFCYGNKFYSSGKLSLEFSNLIIINSISKSLGMSGWRIGYLISNNIIIKSLIKLNQHLITCAPTILSEYIATNFKDLYTTTRKQALQLLDKRSQILEYLNEANISYADGNSTFYIFVDISSSKFTSSEFATLLIEKHKIAVVPGISYGNGCDNFIRIGIGVESIDRIKSAIEIVRIYLK